MRGLKVLVMAVGLAGAASLTAGAPVLASGTTRYVAITGSDTGSCQPASSPCKTIGYALSQSAAGDTISIAAGTYNEAILISTSVTLAGAGESTTIIDGGGADTTVHILSFSATVAISDLTIRDGKAQNGGGVSNSGPSLTLTHVTVSGNTAQPATASGGNLPAAGGGIYSQAGTVTLVHSKVSGNKALGEAGTKGAVGGGSGGIGGMASGGGIYGVGTNFVFQSSVITGNKATGGKGGAGGDYTGGTTSGTGGGGGDGGSGQGGGVFNDGGTMSFTSTTVTNNTAQSGGGGNGGGADPGTGGAGGAADSEYDGGCCAFLMTSGGGIDNGGTHTFGHAANVTITGSTISGNNVVDGKGGHGGTGTAVGGAGDTWTTCGRAEGGGIEHAWGAAGGNLTITGSTISDNTATSCTGGAGGAGAAGKVSNGGAGGSGGNANPVWGGGIFFDNVNYSLAIATSTLSGNTAQSGAGGVGGDGGAGAASLTGVGFGGGSGGSGGWGHAAYGGAIAFGNSVGFSLTDSTLSGNTAAAGAGAHGGNGGKGGKGAVGSGGGPGGAGGLGGSSVATEGGAIYAVTSNSLGPFDDDTVADNSAAGGAGGNGGAGGDGGSGTPVGNSGPSGGGGNGSDGDGGAMHANTAGFPLTNDTVAGNSAAGGTFGQGNPAGTHGNGLGGGLESGGYTLADTIVATNTVSGGNALGPDCDSSTVTTHGDNLIGAGDSCSTISSGDGHGDQVGSSAAPLDPLLGALAANGGPTQTMALHPGSPAIAQGSASTCLAAPVNDLDQRGFQRRSTPRGACDIGAYDTAEPARLGVSGPETATAGQSFSITVTAVDAFGNTVAGYRGRVKFSSSDPSATLPAAYTFTAGDAGVHTFTVTLATVGSQTVTVKDKSEKLLTGTSPAISVSS